MITLCFGRGWNWLVLLAPLPLAAESSFYQRRVAPVFEQHCVTCHGAEKDKGELRLDTYSWILAGGDSGDVIAAGAPADSELLRRITLPEHDDDVMPADGKPLLSADEIKVIELWIAAGAPEAAPESAFAEAPALRPVTPAAPVAPDWRPQAAEIVRLQEQLGLKLVPRSQSPTDGLILRTASSPGRCDDAALARLRPLAPLLVEAELARTRVTDTGLATLAAFENLRRLDLTRTGITSAGLPALANLTKLQTLNLTATAVDDEGVAALKNLPALKQLWLFGTQVTTGAPSPEYAQAGAPAEELPPGVPSAGLTDGVAGGSR